MKYKELVKFIEDKVKEVSASEQNEIVEPKNDSTNNNVQYKPVTINIRRETPKERDLEEKDFEEIMFFKLDEEQKLRKRIREIIKENTTIIINIETPSGRLDNVLPGGKGDSASPENFDSKELEMGIEVEMEHTQDRNVAREIAIDHLSENPKYYTDLKPLEDKEKDLEELFLGDDSDIKQPLLIQKAKPKKMESTTVYDSFDDAMEAVIAFVESKKFEVDETSWFNNVTAGQKAPGLGQTNNYAVELTKSGEPSRKRLHAQVSSIDGGKYQLSAYIN